MNDARPALFSNHWQVIYDVDDDNALIHPEQGVPHANAVDNVLLAQFSGDPTSAVHNPYPCFGGPGNVWPRGFPLDAINEDSSRCEVHAGDASGAERLDSPRVLGVVQALANHDPDVDAIYRLTFPPDGLPFDFDDAPSPGADSRLRVVPDASMTPFNAQVSRALGPHLNTI